jgi:hypothetical protein
MDDRFALQWRLPGRPERLDAKQKAQVIRWLANIERTAAKDPEFAEAVSALLGRIYRHGRPA